MYNSEEQKWIRGIRVVSVLDKELRLFLLSLAIFALISIVKDIADLHRAKIDIFSEEGNGSLFVIIFPMNSD